MTNGRNALPKANAFSLLELLVVVSIILVMAGLIAPAVRDTLARAESAKCKSNLRSIYQANMLYVADHKHYVPAARDIMGKNLSRWHGRRQNTSSPFGGQFGPLAPYLGDSGTIRQCPSFSNYETDPEARNAFESSCGGYGYNISGVGSRIYLEGRNPAAMEKGMRPSSIDQPAQTVMFCDTAFAQPYGDPEYLIEYSFAEPYTFSLEKGDGAGGGRTTPSIHFRHSGKANVVWCDGHVTAESPDLPDAKPYSEFDINWLGHGNNNLFDPY